MSPTILQFGGGAFLRGFADQMVQVANDADLTDHTIAIALTSGRPSPLLEHDAAGGRFHVVLDGVRDGRAVREITAVDCVVEVVDARTDVERYRELTLSRELRLLVSNTTDAGIAWVEGDDLAARPPRSFPAMVAALLHDRFRHYAGDPAAGLAVVCCELIDDNASTLRSYVLRHADAAGLGAAFADWVRDACTFHDTLVDRIVSGYPAERAGELEAEIGAPDPLLVAGELYGQWVIGGDHRIRELLPLDRAGLPVVFADDVAPYRTTKVRILNGQHTALAPLGLLLGCREVHEAVAHPALARYLDLLVGTEILPALPGDRAEGERFAAATRERFGNPVLHHRLSAIMLGALAKWRVRSLPVLRDAVVAGRPAPLTAFGLAATLLLQSGARTVEGFVPEDAPELLAAVAAAFPAGAIDAATGGELRAAIRRVVIEAGWLVADDPALPELVHQTAVGMRELLRDGPESALVAAAERANAADRISAAGPN